MVVGASSPSDTPMDTPKDTGSRDLGGFWWLSRTLNGGQSRLAHKLREPKFASKMPAWKT